MVSPRSPWTVGPWKHPAPTQLVYPWEMIFSFAGSKAAVLVKPEHRSCLFYQCKWGWHWSQCYLPALEVCIVSTGGLREKDTKKGHGGHEKGSWGHEKSPFLSNLDVRSWGLPRLEGAKWVSECFGHSLPQHSAVPAPLLAARLTRRDVQLKKSLGWEKRVMFSRINPRSAPSWRQPAQQADGQPEAGRGNILVPLLWQRPHLQKPPYFPRPCIWAIQVPLLSQKVLGRYICLSFCVCFFSYFKY